MPRLRRFAVLAVLAAAGWFLFQHYQIVGLEHVRVVPREAGGTGFGSWFRTEPSYSADSGDRIRIASFNIQVFGESKLAKPRVMQVLSDVVRQFDVVAVQEIRAVSQDVVPRFVALINANGAQYDYAVGPRLGNTSSKEQYAYIFNTARLELDRGSLYTVQDPENALHREPLVASFRVRGPPPEQAFTFTLVNIHTDPDVVPQELAALDDVYRAVRNDGRGEDDVIILGDLNADDRHLGELGQIPYLTCAISGVPSNTRRTQLYDNIVFDSRASVEFTGVAGVYDLTGEYGLTLEQALEVSDHLPVWAEFSAWEGGAPSRVAARADEAAPSR